MYSADREGTVDCKNQTEDEAKSSTHECDGSGALKAALGRVLFLNLLLFIINHLYLSKMWGVFFFSLFAGGFQTKAFWVLPEMTDCHRHWLHCPNETVRCQRQVLLANIEFSVFTSGISQALHTCPTTTTISQVFLFLLDWVLGVVEGKTTTASSASIMRILSNNTFK